MERVQSNGHWSLFCPSESPGLADVWGEEFEKLYLRYEREVTIVSLLCYLNLLVVYFETIMFVLVISGS